MDLPSPDLRDSANVVVADARRLLTDRARPLLVAIDGASGSGKSVLAALVAEQYATRAVALLVRSRDAGFFRDPAAREQFTKDADLDPLRSRDDFRKFVDSLEKK
jgi:pantothenate kinase-related protein Tda10